jgi:hypothetical protein
MERPCGRFDLACRNDLSGGQGPRQTFHPLKGLESANRRNLCGCLRDDGVGSIEYEKEIDPRRDSRQ